MSKMTDIMRSLGRRDALDLRAKAAGMTATQIIDREISIPAFDPQKDYTACPVGTPVTFEGNVYGLIQPHNAAHYPSSNPRNTRSLWAILHTQNPQRAKPWEAPLGTSGMYMQSECYKDESGKVWRCLGDNTVHTAAELPSAWEEVAAE